MRKQILIGALLLTCFSSIAQNFEGWITYKVEAINPMPERIADSTWQQIIKDQFGEKGYMVQKSYYKNGDYMSEIEIGEQKGFQTYNPTDGLIYSWQDESDTVITLNSKVYLDPFVGITHLDKLDTILNVPCKSILVKSAMGEMTIWYNSEYLKLDSKYYEGHKYAHWEQIVEEINCLPLKIEQKDMSKKIVVTAMEYKDSSIEQSKFEIKDFKVVLENPVN